MRNYRDDIADHVFAAMPMRFKSIDFGEQTESTFTLEEITGVSQAHLILPNVKWIKLKMIRTVDLDLVAAKLSCEAPYVEEHFLELARFIAVNSHFTLTKIQGELELASEQSDRNDVNPVTITYSQGGHDRKEIHTTVDAMRKAANLKEGSTLE